MRDHAHTLSDFRVPTLSSECEPCGRRGPLQRRQAHGKVWRRQAARAVLADCPKARSFSVYDQCKVVYGKDSRSSTPGTLRE